jgi:DNA repair exonuclease SbcCD ATPase subunit
MPKITKTAPRTRRPKAEVQQEFTAVQEEVAAAREAADAKSEQLRQAQEAEVRQKVDGLSVESVVEKISGLGVEISKALAGLSARLVEEVERLAAVREAVRIESDELARLHKIDVAATALDHLVQDYAREKERLDAEIAAQRAAWEEELKTTERERKEQEENLRKQRQREIDEYEYKKALERKKAQDKYDEEQRLLEKKNREKQEALEKSWQEREAALKEQEAELARLKKEAETFPARLQKEVEQAAAQAARAAEARFEQQAVLLRKDAEADKRMAELKIKSLEEIIAQQAAQLVSLQKQLDEAKRQVQEIAVKAIEGASGARALAHVNQIAIEQAKNRPQS